MEKQNLIDENGCANLYNCNVVLSRQVVTNLAFLQGDNDNKNEGIIQMKQKLQSLISFIFEVDGGDNPCNVEKAQRYDLLKNINDMNELLDLFSI